MVPRDNCRIVFLTLLGVVLPHLPCEISAARFCLIQKLSPNFHKTFSRFQSVLVIFSHFQSLASTSSYLNLVKNAGIYWQLKGKKSPRFLGGAISNCYVSVFSKSPDPGPSRAFWENKKKQGKPTKKARVSRGDLERKKNAQKKQGKSEKAKKQKQGNRTDKKKRGLEGQGRNVFRTLRSRGLAESAVGPDKITTDLFLRRFREGISFPNFLERSIPRLPLSKLCAVPFSLQKRALFKGEKRVKRCREKERKRGWPAKGAKRKKGRAKTGQTIETHLRPLPLKPRISVKTFLSF